MALDHVNAIVGLLTLLVVSLASVAALVQLRHLRAANTLNGLLEVLRQWQDPRLQNDLGFVRNELPARLRDPSYRESLRQRPVDRTVHRELFVCDWYEQIGSYLKHGLLDERVFMDVSCSSVSNAWRNCWPAIEIMRESAGDQLYENFEYAAVRGRMFIERYPNGVWPTRVPRMRAFAARPLPPVITGGTQASAALDVSAEHES